VYSREVSFLLLAVVLAIGAAPDALQCLAVEMGGVGAFELIPDAGPNFAEVRVFLRHVAAIATASWCVIPTLERRARPPAVRSRLQRSSAPRLSPYAWPRRVWPRPRATAARDSALNSPIHISQDRESLLQGSDITRPNGLLETTLCQGCQCCSPRAGAIVERAVTI
jgi:hypothetical protein